MYPIIRQTNLDAQEDALHKIFYQFCVKRYDLEFADIFFNFLTIPSILLCFFNLIQVGGAKF